MKLAALISGGKDSLYAMKKAMEDHEIKVLISIESVEDSMMFHTQNLELVKLQSEALDIPLNYRKTPESRELDVLEQSIGEVSDKIDGVVSGAIDSEYQRKRIQNICEDEGVETITPIWNVDEENYMESLIEDRFEVIITKVAAQGLDRSWLGEKLDKDNLRKLKRIKERTGIHLAGEGGEYETLVTDCPIFDKRIETEILKEEWNRKTKTGRISLKGRLEDKN